MANPHLIKSYVAGGTIAAYSFVKFGSSDGTVVQATAATDLIIGVCNQPGGASSGDRVDIVHSGIAELSSGGSITRGAKLTTDSSGNGVAAAPSAGSNAQIGAIALVSAASGDVFNVLVVPSVMQG